MRVVPVIQSTVLENQGEFFAKTIEMQFDLVVMMIQQIVENLSRAVVGTVEQVDSGEAYQALIAALNEAKAARDAAKAWAEESRAHAQDYIPFSFGRFRIDDDGCLVVDYYGDAGTDDIKIADDGCVYIYTGDEPKINLGKGRIVFKGAYSDGAQYSFYDCVKHNGSWWLHIGQEATTGDSAGRGSRVDCYRFQRRRGHNNCRYCNHGSRRNAGRRSQQRKPRETRYSISLFPKATRGLKGIKRPIHIRGLYLRTARSA